MVTAEAKAEAVTVGGGGGGGRGGGDGGGYEKTEATKAVSDARSLGSLTTTRLAATIRRYAGGEAARLAAVRLSARLLPATELATVLRVPPHLPRAALPKILGKNVTTKLMF